MLKLPVLITDLVLILSAAALVTLIFRKCLCAPKL